MNCVAMDHPGCSLSSTAVLCNSIVENFFLSICATKINETYFLPRPRQPLALDRTSRIEMSSSVHF